MTKYVENMKQATSVTRHILTFFAIWPLSKESSLIKRLAHRLCNIVFYSLFFFILIPSLSHMFLREQNLQRKIKLLGPAYNCFMGICKYTCLLYYGDKLEECLRHMKKDWKIVTSNVYGDIMKEQAKLGRRLVTIVTIFTYVSGLCFRLILPLSRKPIVTARNITVKPLAVPSYFIFFDEQVSPAYEIVFVLQFFAGVTVYSMNCGLCGLATMFVMHACGQFRILMERMAEPDFDRRNFDKKLIVIVEQNVRVRSFLTKVESVLCNMCLIEIIGNTFLVCLCIYYITVEWGNNSTAMLTYFMILLSFVFSIFIFCYIGEVLTDQNRKVFNKACEMDWLDLQPKKAQQLILIIAISNRPINITAGKVMELSLASFTHFIDLVYVTKKAIYYILMLWYHLIVEMVIGLHVDFINISNASYKWHGPQRNLWDCAFVIMRTAVAYFNILRTVIS